MITPSTLPADYHIHTPYCRHAFGKIVDFVNAAITMGISEICFSDHLGRYYLSPSQKRRYWDWGMADYMLDRYIEEVRSVQTAFSDQITIKVGLEVDYVEGAENLLRPIIETRELDFLLASIHCLPQFSWKHLASFDRKETWSIYQNYFQTTHAAIDSNLFDSLAHPDFIWRYVKWPEAHRDEVYASIRSVVAHATHADMAVEINANGLLWSHTHTINGPDPFEIFLGAVRDSRTFVTIGSDAHKPEFVAKSFDEIRALCRTFAIPGYSTYSARVRAFNPFT